MGTGPPVMPPKRTLQIAIPEASESAAPPGLAQDADGFAVGSRSDDRLTPTLGKPCPF